MQDQRGTPPAPAFRKRSLRTVYGISKGKKQPFMGVNLVDPETITPQRPQGDFSRVSTGMLEQVCALETPEDFERFQRACRKAYRWILTNRCVIGKDGNAVLVPREATQSGPGQVYSGETFDDDDE